MNDLSKYKLSYNDYKIDISVINKLCLDIDGDNKELSILEVVVTKKNGSVVYLGDFYGLLPKVLSNDEISKMISYLMDNIDYILYENSGFIGVFDGKEVTLNDKITAVLRRKMNNSSELELKNIYEEYMSMKKDTKEHVKYAHFLELYFNSHKIPDSIVGSYLGKRRKSILDYDDVSCEIKKDFNMNVYDSTSTYEYENNLELLSKLNIEINEKVEELKVLDSFINKIDDLLMFQNNNIKTKKEIGTIEQELDELKMFDKRKKELKQRLKELKNGFIKIDMVKVRDELKVDISERYTSKYADTHGIIALYDRLSLEDLYQVFNEIHSVRERQHLRLLDKYNNVSEMVHYHEENFVDIGDLYDRVDNSNRKKS